MVCSGGVYWGTDQGTRAMMVFEQALDSPGESPRGQLERADPVLSGLLQADDRFYLASIDLIAGMGTPTRAVREAMQIAQLNRAQEGVPGRRFLGAGGAIEEIETLANGPGGCSGPIMRTSSPILGRKRIRQRYRPCARRETRFSQWLWTMGATLAMDTGQAWQAPCTTSSTIMSTQCQERSTWTSCVT